MLMSTEFNIERKFDILDTKQEYLPLLFVT
jgi:hypothetical protein